MPMPFGRRPAATGKLDSALRGDHASILNTTQAGSLVHVAAAVLRKRADAPLPRGLRFRPGTARPRSPQVRPEATARKG